MKKNFKFSDETMSNIKCLIFFISWVFIFSGCCRTSEITSSPSPDNKNKAVVFQFDCGATTGYSTHVAILPNEHTLKTDPFSEDSIEGTVFRVNDSYFSTASKPLELYVKVNWIDNNHLEIAYLENFETYRTDKNFKDIIITYKTYKVNKKF